MFGLSVIKTSELLRLRGIETSFESALEKQEAKISDLTVQNEILAGIIKGATSYRDEKGRFVKHKSKH
jgi:hypothetical protein